MSPTHPASVGRALGLSWGEDGRKGRFKTDFGLVELSLEQLLLGTGGSDWGFPDFVRFFYSKLVTSVILLMACRTCKWKIEFSCLHANLFGSASRSDLRQGKLGGGVVSLTRSDVIAFWGFLWTRKQFNLGRI